MGGGAELGGASSVRQRRAKFDIAAHQYGNSWFVSKDASREQYVCLFAAQQFAYGRSGGTIRVDDHPDEEERQRSAIDLFAHDNFGPSASSTP